MHPTPTTQLTKKLLIKTAQTWLFLNPPERFLGDFDGLNIEIKTSILGVEKFDGVLLFVQNSAQLKAALTKIIVVLKLETVCWIAYPKKSSGIVSDLEMTGNWAETGQYHLRIVSAASIDKTWTALRLRPLDQVKKSTISNAAIQNNDLNEFIDTKNRIVHLPEDVKQALEKEPAAFAIYQKLAYSHQKEHLVWILTAKREETRKARIVKMMAMLQQKNIG